MGFISDLTGQTGARAAASNRADAQARETINNQVLHGAYGNANQYGVAARDAWNPIARRGETFGNADPILMSALGIGDPELARSAFRSGPGYDFAMEQGLEAVRRSTNAGRVPTGNQWTALQQTGQGIANQEWQNYLRNLMSTSAMGGQYAGTAAAGQAGAYGNLAGYARDYGRDAVGVTNTAGQQVQSATAGEAAARQAGAGNIAALGLAGAQMLAGGLGGAGGFGSIGKMVSGLGGAGGGGAGAYASYPTNVNWNYA
jgi:hypothetical protein